MLQRVIDAAVDRKISRTVTPEWTAELLADLLGMLHNGIGQLGLPTQLLDYVESQLDLEELSAFLTPRIRHYLGVSDG